MQLARPYEAHEVRTLEVIANANDYDAVLSRALQRMAALDSLNRDTDRKEATDEYLET